MSGSNLAPDMFYKYKSNVISFEDLRKEKEVKAKPKHERKGGKVAGQSSEVYPFSKKEDIAAIINVFNNHIETAATPTQKRIAYRNRMLLLIGLNAFLRASDLRTLQYSFFFDEKSDGTLEFKKFYTIMPKKTRKHKKFVKLFFNDVTKKAVMDYIEEYPFESLDDYLFASRKGDEPITAVALGRIIKDAAIEAGIEYNVNSHSLRKSAGYWMYRNAENQSSALVLLQNILGHSNQTTTMRYIGITTDEIEEAFDSLNLGIEFM